MLVKRPRAEVKVSTLSDEQKRELVEAKDKELTTFCQAFCSRGGIVSKDLTVCIDENALGCDDQG